ncbi:fatty-acid O-methyltransferase Mtf2 [Mycobacterium sp. pR1184]|uniref:fatty-acid O-methyltransferase Mtf2 n=1 Tax=Mycobacterium sp. pR1184 TaxID=3238981 RepID=UPI00351B0E5B
MELEAPEFRPSPLWTLKAKFIQFVYQYFYPYLTRRLRADDVLFLNYGYEEDPPMGIPLSASDEHDRYFIQLYHRVATQVDLAGKRVLEVGCGHGGGASYLMRTAHPASYTALDLNPIGIAFCQKRHRLAGLEFIKGDAEDLPFPDQSFDAVINIESSHLYREFPRFLDEVGRVLRPRGHFLYADFRFADTVADWEKQLANAPMTMLSHTTINEQVVRGMEKNSQWWVRAVDRLVPAILHRWLLVHGYVLVWRVHQDMQSGGSTDYRMYCFAKV